MFFVTTGRKLSEQDNSRWNKGKTQVSCYSKIVLLPSIQDIPVFLAWLLEKLTDVNRNIAEVQPHIIEINYHRLPNERK